MNENQVSGSKDYTSVLNLSTSLESIINGVGLLDKAVGMLNEHKQIDFIYDDKLILEMDECLKECDNFFSSIESLVKKNPDRVCNVKDNCEKSEKEKAEKISDTIASFAECFRPDKKNKKFDKFDMFNEAVKGDEGIKGGICAIATGSACMSLDDIENFLREKKSYIQMFVNDICEILGHKSKAYLEKSIPYRDRACYLRGMSGYKLDADAVNTEMDKREGSQSGSTSVYNQFGVEPVRVELNERGLLQKLLDLVKNLFVEAKKEVEKPHVSKDNNTNEHNSKSESTLKKENDELNK